MNTFTRKQSRIVWFLVALTFVSRFALAFRSDENQASRLFKDDAYYMFSCARHFAIGDGLSADGIHPTNGIQPLMVVLEVPCFLLSGGDRWLGVRITYILFALFCAVSVYLSSMILRTLQFEPPGKKDPGSGLRWFIDPVILCAALWTFSYPILDQMMNGMETGLYTMVLLITILYYARIEVARLTLTNSPSIQSVEGSAGMNTPGSFGRFAILGLIFGILILSRIDALFFLAAVGLSEIIRYRMIGFKRILICGTLALLISAPWWIYNYIGFGSIIPISGQAEAHGNVFLLTNLRLAGSALTDLLSLLFAMHYMDAQHTRMIVGWIVLGLTTASIVLVRTHAFQIIRRNIVLRPLVPFLIASILLGCFYTFAFNAPWYITRYLQPLRTLWFLLAPMLIAEFISTFRVRAVAIRIAAVLYLALGMAFTVERYSNDFMATGVADLYQTGVWARAHPDARIGMSQSGITGFVADNVWNLDGKVNPDALRAIQADSLGKYIVHNNIAYLADWTDLAENLARQANSTGASYKLVDSIILVRIYKRVQ